MSNSERIREACNGSLDPRYVRERQDAGWRLVGVEWEREAPAQRTARPDAGAPRSTAVADVTEISLDVPVGSRVVPEGSRLEEDPEEMQFLFAVMELIIQDISITKVAEELNRRGFHTRAGNPWGPVAIFNLLPRLVELTPRIFRSEEWVERRKNLTPVF
jgi:Recombinase